MISLMVMVAFEIMLLFKANSELNKIVRMKRVETLKLSPYVMDLEIIKMQIKSGNLEERHRERHFQIYKEIEKRFFAQMMGIEIERVNFVAYFKKDLAFVMSMHRYENDWIIRDINYLERSLQADLDSKARMDKLEQKRFKTLNGLYKKTS
jgi:hypothetical protein